MPFTLLGILISNALALPQTPSTQPIGNRGQAKETDTAPQLKLDTSSYTIDVTSSGQNIEKVFTLFNLGSKPLALEVEGTSCGCVGATLSTKTLAPSQGGTLTFKMQADNWGSKTEYVTLKTNDPNQPTLTVEAKMPPTVVPSPALLTVKTAEGEVAKRYVSLKMPHGAFLESVSAMQPFILTQILEKTPINGGSVQRVAVSVTAAAPSGTFKDNLTFRLKDAPASQIVVPIQGVVEEDVQVDSSQFFLGQIAVGSTRRKTVLVQSHSNKTFRIQTSQTSSQHVKVQATPGVAASSHAVEIIVQADGKIGSVLQENVRLTLSTGRILEISITGMVSPANATTTGANGLRIGYLAPDFMVTDSRGNHLVTF
jgi:hypothetical protein